MHGVCKGVRLLVLNTESKEYTWGCVKRGGGWWRGQSELPVY